MDMKQVAAAIERRGGKAKVAAIAGAVLSAPYRRRQEKSGGGTGRPSSAGPIIADCSQRENFRSRASAVFRTE
jgi:hypothetical protein